MPNWIEGTLKARGKRENIRRFFLEGCVILCDSGEKSPEDRSNDSRLWIDFHGSEDIYIEDTRRAFISCDEVYMEEEEGVICVNVRQAWAFDGQTGDLDRWKAISDQFDIDIKLFGIERGMEFVQEVIILREGKNIVNFKTYEDWDWECPFPCMGG